jgi:hypothetical protein
MFSANITNRDPAKILLKNTADRGFPQVLILVGFLDGAYISEMS